MRRLRTLPTKYSTRLCLWVSENDWLQTSRQQAPEGDGVRTRPAAGYSVARVFPLFPCDPRHRARLTTGGKLIPHHGLCEGIRRSSWRRWAPFGIPWFAVVFSMHEEFVGRSASRWVGSWCGDGFGIGHVEVGGQCGKCILTHSSK